jgi:arsenite methyltransferase
MPDPNQTREIVREKYRTLAEAGTSCCTGCGCGEPSLEQIGYTADQTGAIPEGANLGLGCGNPLAFADARPGETVLDLGSGAGIDAFLASRAVGDGGRVIGVDMTPAMVDRARRNTESGSYSNVEFRIGEIEHLPVADSSVDAIISNCVINLSPDKAQVFREAFRVLRGGGRMVVSDLVWLETPPDEIRASVEARVGCVAGASLKDDYLSLIRSAGFENIEVLAQDGYGGAGCCEGDTANAVASVKVRAYKPAAGTAADGAGAPDSKHRT